MISYKTQGKPRPTVLRNGQLEKRKKKKTKKQKTKSNQTN